MHQYYDNTGASCVQSTSKITAGYRCEVICFQLPSLPCYKVSVQLIISALHPPVFKMHYHNAPESQLCIVIEFNQLRREKLLNFSCAFITCRNKHVSNFQYIFQQTAVFLILYIMLGGSSLDDHFFNALLIKWSLNKDYPLMVILIIRIRGHDFLFYFATINSKAFSLSTNESCSLLFWKPCLHTDIA